ncbi:zinc-ribbon domain-containing protein [Prochlorococcus marinus]|uniref:zinc-ribbon domain-containing protein n=1 Tax=Prochlorococcus marinus TaxID=1219 RepID=UPI0022B4D56C|nr:zinc-ribbon domain-containing protein [Prochlorococcus marinus]
MVIDPKRTLQYKFPEIAKEWHPTLNNPLTPDSITYGSGKKVWWQCPKFENHIYDICIRDRTGKRKQGCSFCSGKRISPERSLAFLSPEIAKEWHPIKNGSLTPKDFFNSSSEKVWWQCRKFKSHVWDARIAGRTQDGKGCRFCGQAYQSSKPEMRILAELRSVFENVIFQKKIKHKNKVIGFDIYLPDIQLGIEYNGVYYHSDHIKKKNDLIKNKILDKKGIYLIRVREMPLGKIQDSDILVNKNKLVKNDLNKLFSIIRKIKIINSDKLSKSINKYIENTNFSNQELYQIYIKNFPSPLPENSLQKLFPNISKEWHLEKNSPLTPLDFTPGSNQIVWWQCPRFKDHIYESPIKDRARSNGRGTGCSFCGGKIISPERSLAFLSPEVAKEWHPTKNGSLKPENVFNGSGEKVWWQCQKNKDHVWDAVIASRTSGRGCPDCPRKKRAVSIERSLAFLSPEVAKEWRHPTKNGSLKPKDVFNGSSEKVWWQCQKNKDHIWEGRVKDRTRKDKRRSNGCRICNPKKTKLLTQNGS